MKRSMVLLFSVVVMGWISPANGGILTSVPMQGGMVHVSVTFHDTTDSLSVEVDPIIPELTPLSVSNPGDSFASGDPWTIPLSGKAFSRRYGFVVDDESDTRPVGTSIWIRQVSASPGLETYRYRGNPKEFYGIFGFDGSSDTWQWDAIMFHPTYVVPSGIGTYQAEYEVFVADLATQQPAAGYTPATFTLDFTSVPEPVTLVFLLSAGVLYLRKRR